MRDYLTDIVTHIVPFGTFNNMRIDGTDDGVEISATDAEREVIIRGKLHTNVKDFNGLFGVSNLTLLQTLINIPEYQDEKATVKVLSEDRNGVNQPTYIHFENANGDFVNDFRLMASNLIDKIEPKLAFKVSKWAVEFAPAINAHQRLKYQASAHPGEKIVTFRVENGEINASIGDGASHHGKFVFHSGIDPKIKKTVVAPVLHVITALSLTGDKLIHMDDLGMMITVDSGLASYNYIIPTLSK